jgi:tetratricopeptide (TPR) repeat protein
MAFDKAKVVHAAEKYLAQGKIASAVQEYRRIVDADPEDFTALNTLGDLYARLDKKSEAVQCFTLVADHYREQGFALKAIAIYKKVARLRPEELTVAQKLAALYEQQGLIVEARAQYLHIADACMRAKQTRAALEALRRTADLDPQNAEIRLRLAEGFMQEAMPDEAADAFAEAGTRLHARNDYQGALRAFTLANDLRPSSHAIMQGLVDANLALGATEEAAAVLEAAVEQAPGDTELHAMLARVYLDAEDAPAADRAAEKLVNADQSNYPLLFEVAQLYLQQGDAHAAVRVLTRAVEPALAKRQEKHLLELLNGALARDPEHIEALRLLLRIYTWQRDDDRMRIALERLAEAAQAQELYEEERNALEHLVRLVPFDQSYAERLSTLNEILGGRAPDAGTTSTAELPTRAPAQTLPAAPSDEAALRVEEPEPSAPPELPAFGDLFETNSVAPEMFAAPQPIAPPAPTSEFEFHNVAATEAVEPPADPSASFADLNEEFADKVAASAPVEPGVTFESAVDFTMLQSADEDEEQEVHVTDPLDASVLPGESAKLSATADRSDERVQALLAQELESVDYYLAQGYTDIARDTLDMLAQQYGASAEISARRKRLQTAQEPAPLKPAATTFELPLEPVLGAAPAQPARPNNTQPPARQVALDPGLAAVFDEFRNSIEEDAEPVTSADYETHYNTGLAYMEMGMIDPAIEEFQTAATLVAPQDGTPRYLQCCNLLGHCFMQQSLPRAAALWFRKGLAAPGHSEEEYQALRYELATAYEQMGDIDRAIDTFQEVYGIDVSYRGVTDKLKELQAQKTVTSDK